MLTLFKTVHNVLKLLNKIVNINVQDNDVHIKFKGDLILESNNLFLYSKDGVLITQHKVAHFNPITNNGKNMDFKLGKELAHGTKAIHCRQQALNKMMLDNLSLGKSTCKSITRKNIKFRYTE